MDLMDRIVRVLELMGDSPGQIAATLRGANVRGLCHSTSYMNPIVRYLSTTLDLHARLQVVADDTMLRVFRGTEVHEVKLPAPVNAFLRRFQQGLYPDLEGTKYR